MPPPLRMSPRAARLFAVRALGLDAPLPDLPAALHHLGYVQIDPLNICGRMHDLILRNRVVDYREGDLSRLMYGTADTRRAIEHRVAFEHHVPETNILVAFPLEAWPHLLTAMRARRQRTSGWSGRLTPAERALKPRILAEIRARGPLASDEFGASKRSRSAVWGAATVVKNTLQKLFFHGELLIANRLNNRRRYDLPERVLPANVLAQPAAPKGETERWLAQLKLRQRRLAVLRRDELRVVADDVQPVQVEGCPALHCRREDMPLLERCKADAERADLALAAGVRLLAPLDPLIYDRRLTSALWGFDYTWEAYTPAAKRQRGHYALPVLSGLELVGHIEPKADRIARRLVVASRAVRRGVQTAPAVRELAAWLDCVK